MYTYRRKREDPYTYAQGVCVEREREREGGKKSLSLFPQKRV